MIISCASPKYAPGTLIHTKNGGFVLIAIIKYSFRVKEEWIYALGGYGGDFKESELYFYPNCGGGLFDFEFTD